MPGMRIASRVHCAEKDPLSDTNSFYWRSNRAPAGNRRNSVDSRGISQTAGRGYTGGDAHPNPSTDAHPHSDPG